MTRVSDEPCVVLHTRAYRETSLLVSVLSLNFGKVALVAKGVRGNRRGRLLQPLNVLRAGWYGRSSLVTLGSFEAERQPWLQGDALAAGLYLLELVSRLVGERETHPRLFAALVWALEHLQDDLEPTLRRFERVLLEELGYGIDFSVAAPDQAPIRCDAHYRFEPDVGFERTSSESGFPGDVLLAIGADDYETGAARRLAKRLFRRALRVHLGSKPLASRELLYPRRP